MNWCVDWRKTTIALTLAGFFLGVFGFKFIEQQLNVKLNEKLDGLDQRYWDFIYNNCLLTLHLEQYLGLSIYTYEINEQSIAAIRGIVIKIENNFNK